MLYSVQYCDIYHSCAAKSYANWFSAKIICVICSGKLDAHLNFTAFINILYKQNTNEIYEKS
jgi:hypothetical protein